MTKYLQAIANLFRRKEAPSRMNTAEWNAVGPKIRQRSFFSATVATARVLTRYREMLLQSMEAATEEVIDPMGNPQVRYAVGTVAEFKRRAAEFLLSEGLADKEDFQDVGVKSTTSFDRLQLIYNTNIQAANQFAFYQRYTQDIDSINAWPAARFVRRPGATIKRQRHVEAENEVRRWDDIDFWLHQNAEDIGGFGVPWGPWGFNSYMFAQPVSRKEAERLGLVRKGEVLKPVDLSPWGWTTPAKAVNAGLDADLGTVAPEIADKAREKIRTILGPQAIDANGNATLDTLRRLRNA